MPYDENTVFGFRVLLIFMSLNDSATFLLTSCCSHEAASLALSSWSCLATGYSLLISLLGKRHRLSCRFGIRDRHTHIIDFGLRGEKRNGFIEIGLPRV